MQEHIKNGEDDTAKAREASRKKKESAEQPFTAEKAKKEAAKTVEGILRDLGEDAGAAQKAAAPQSEKDAVSPDIVTGEDGQNAFAFHEIDRFAPAESEESETEEEFFGEDEAQLKLFSSFEIEKPDGRRSEGPAFPESGEEERQNETQTEKDIRFLLDMDYEDELGNAIGFDQIRAYRELDINGENKKLKRRKKGEKREFEAPGQGISMRKQYAAQHKGYLLQFIFSAVLLVLFFFYERPYLLKKVFPFLSDGTVYRAPYILIGLQLLVFASIFSYRRLFEGLTQLVRFAPIDSSYCAVMMLGTLSYHVVLLFLRQDGYPTLFLSPVAGSLLFLKLADLLDWRRESSAFQVVSSRKDKFALLPRVSVGGPRNNAREKLYAAEDDENFLYVCPVSFVRHYFANTDKRAEYPNTIGVQLLLTFAVGIALSLVVFATGGSATETVQTAFVTFLLSIPLTSLLVTSLPMYFASVMRLKRKSAIVGEETVYRSDGDFTLVLPDKDVFCEVRQDAFEFVKGCNRPAVEQLLHALLVKVGSPLADTVRGGEEEIEITLTEIAERGVAAFAGEKKTPIVFGDVEYLKKYGIEVQSRRENLEEIRRRLLCVAIDGKVQALSLVRYRFTDDMLRLFEELDEDDVRVLIRTKDPAVYDAMLKRLVPHGKTPVRALKPSAKETDISTARADVTVVSLDSPQETARAFTVCRRVRRVGLFGKWLGVISTAVGVAMAGILAFSGRIGKASGISVTLYLFSWGFIHALVSYLKLRERKE